MHSIVKIVKFDITCMFDHNLKKKTMVNWRCRQCTVYD